MNAKEKLPIQQSFLPENENAQLKQKRQSKSSSNKENKCSIVKPGSIKLEIDQNPFSKVIGQTKPWILEENIQKNIEMKTSKRQASSPAKSTNHKRSALGNISNVLHRPTVVNSKDFIKQPPKEKENTSTRRRSLRLQAKAYFSKPLTSADSKVKVFVQDKNTSFTSSQGSKSSKEDSDLKDPLEYSPLPSFFYEHKASPKRSLLKYVDFDATNSHNINEAPDYAFTVFEYMRAREHLFPIKSGYLAESQLELTSDMRAILVDWMVEVQENFELNHETLYLAVKLVDHYLQKVRVSRRKLQLVGATALLIAAKFDERHPPYIDDFLYICDDAYNRNDVLTTERAILIRVGFDINIPISYRFLRRYAKCLKASMETLTLARFVLELSLQCYEMVNRSASKLGAAALWLALKMKKSSQVWNDTLIYYTSHEEDDILELACDMNGMVVESKAKKLKTIWHKYSHSIFYEVAKIPPLTDERIKEERARVYKLGDPQCPESKNYVEL